MTLQVEEIIRRAEERGQQKRLGYRGAVTPEEAWALLQSSPDAKLIDVRTREEWDLVGRVPGAVELEFSRYGTWERNPDFLNGLRACAKAQNILLFLCRSAVRSHHAAELATHNGFPNCFNVLEGFEGDKNAQSQRAESGWKLRGLPWHH